MARSKLTGTQKKQQKRDLRFTHRQQDVFEKEQKKSLPYRESARHFEKQIQKGRHLPKYDKTDYKKASFEKTKYNPHDLKQLTKDFEKAGKGAEKIFAPVRENALAQFNQQTEPEVAGQFAPNAYGGSSGSSAMNQALAAAQGNLQRNLASDFAGLQANLANNLMTSREQQRQFGAQFGAQQNQFGAQFKSGENQFGAQFRNNQNQFGAQTQLAGLDRRLQAAGALSGTPMAPAYSGLASADPYMSKGQQGGPSTAGTIIGRTLEAGGTIGGAYLGGPAGAAAGNAAARGVNTAFISGYNQM